MANQEARRDGQNSTALIAHSAVSGAAETRQVVATDGALWTTSADGTITANNYSIRIEDDDSGTVYYGYTAPGNGTSVGSAVWRIKRSVETGGTSSFMFADGNTNFDNVWSGKGTYNYS